jgi:hypothetical protein
MLPHPSKLSCKQIDVVLHAPDLQQQPCSLLLAWLWSSLTAHNSSGCSTPATFCHSSSPLPGQKMFPAAGFALRATDRMQQQLIKHTVYHHATLLHNSHLTSRCLCYLSPPGRRPVAAPKRPAAPAKRPANAKAAPRKPAAARGLLEATTPEPTPAAVPAGATIDAVDASRKPGAAPVKPQQPNKQQQQPKKPQMPNKPANRPATRPGAAKPPRNNKPVNAWAVGPNRKPAVNNRNNRMNTQRPKQQQKPNNQANRKMGGNKQQANRRP